MLWNIFLLLLLTLLLFSCENPNTTQFFETRGTILYIELEGGFYGIISDNGKHLDPINLKNDFKHHGLQVWLSYKERADLAFFHMWVTLIEIIQIEKIEE